LAAVLTVAALAVPAGASAAVSITAYKINSDLPAAGVPSDGPSTLQAGANPNAGSYSAFAYTTPGVDDVRTAITNFAPGLLGNPEAVPKCSQANLLAGGAACSTSAIGTSRLDTNAFGSFPGTVYNAEPLGNEPGRLGVVTNAGPLGTLVSSIPFTITPRGATDYGLTGTLSDITILPGGAQVTGLSFLINGATNAYVRNPTSCQSQTSTGEANSYADATLASGPSYTFTTTGCDTVPFRPKIAIEIGDKGTTKLNGFPPVVIRITQPNGDSDQRGNVITLPPELNTNNRAYKTCTQAQADADACPPNSKFGNVSATSPFLAEPLKGPVYLIQQSSSSLPGLLLDLQGRAHVKIQTRTQLVNNRLIQSISTNTPQLPISALTVALNGGKDTGVFQNRENLCFRGESTYKVNEVNAVTKFSGWNGKSTADLKYQADIAGCGPRVDASLTGAAGSPRLVVKASRHPDAPKFKEALIKLGRNLSLVRSRIDEGLAARASARLPASALEYVDSRTLRVTGLPSDGSKKVVVYLRRGAIEVSDRTRSLVRRGRSKTFSVKVTQTPVTGAGTSTKGSFKAKR
jgi:hypothetical protein